MRKHRCAVTVPCIRLAPASFRLLSSADVLGGHYWRDRRVPVYLCPAVPLRTSPRDGCGIRSRRQLSTTYCGWASDRLCVFQWKRGYASLSERDLQASQDNHHMACLSVISDMLYRNEMEAIVGSHPDAGRDSTPSPLFDTCILNGPHKGSLPVASVEMTAAMENISPEDLMACLQDDAVELRAATEGSGTTVTTVNTRKHEGMDDLSPTSPLIAVQDTVQDSVLSLLRLGNEPDERLSSTFQAATELLLQGVDLKALLADGTLRDMRLTQRYLSQGDYSTMHFARVTAQGTDFSRSLFYGAVFENVVFRHCSFDGCVLKGVRCVGRVLFEQCTFRFATIGLRWEASSRVAKGGCRSMKAVGGKTPTGVRFVNCNFDLAEFKESAGLDRPECFVDCANSHIAAGFPLRGPAG